ncbi:hypothetical protein, partial [Ferrovum sp.]|uniref:hypothetical protein n=1 Tax=Ferrovum sp. TaxID=2609467 RepID=UPI00262D2D88
SASPTIPTNQGLWRIGISASIPTKPVFVGALAKLPENGNSNPSLHLAYLFCKFGRRSAGSFERVASTQAQSQPFWCSAGSAHAGAGRWKKDGDGVNMR